MQESSSTPFGSFGDRSPAPTLDSFNSFEEYQNFAMKTIEQQEGEQVRHQHEQNFVNGGYDMRYQDQNMNSSFDQMRVGTQPIQPRLSPTVIGNSNYSPSQFNRNYVPSTSGLIYQVIYS